MKSTQELAQDALPDIVEALKKGAAHGSHYHAKLLIRLAEKGGKPEAPPEKKAGQ